MSFIKINLVLKTDRPTDIPKKPTKVSIEGTCSRYKCRQLQNRGKLWGNLSTTCPKTNITAAFVIRIYCIRKNLFIKCLKLLKISYIRQTNQHTHRHKKGEVVSTDHKSDP